MLYLSQRGLKRRKERMAGETTIDSQVGIKLITSCQHVAAVY
jgi:hypothetical protein